MAPTAHLTSGGRTTKGSAHELDNGTIVKLQNEVHGLDWTMAATLGLPADGYLVTTMIGLFLDGKMQVNFMTRELKAFFIK
uniref:Uncharacterized protein n=1 Tax=Peronospora matthiolae TaxID=2874970 RepID=A0AAV1UNV5_9STRA